MTIADSFQRLVEERDAALAEVERLRGALEVFDKTEAPRTHVDALDVIAELRYALGGHHVAYPENEGDPLYDRSACEGPWQR